jgi:hypothetical protein
MYIDERQEAFRKLKKNFVSLSNKIKVGWVNMIVKTRKMRPTSTGIKKRVKVEMEKDDNMPTKRVDIKHTQLK